MQRDRLRLPDDLFDDVQAEMTKRSRGQRNQRRRKQQRFLPAARHRPLCHAPQPPTQSRRASTPPWSPSASAPSRTNCETPRPRSPSSISKTAHTEPSTSPTPARSSTHFPIRQDALQRGARASSQRLRRLPAQRRDRPERRPDKTEGARRRASFACAMGGRSRPAFRKPIVRNVGSDASSSWILSYGPIMRGCPAIFGAMSLRPESARSSIPFVRSLISRSRSAPPCHPPSVGAC